MGRFRSFGSGVLGMKRTGANAAAQPTPLVTDAANFVAAAIEGLGTNEDYVVGG